MNDRNSHVDALCRSATRCRTCFQQLLVRPALINIAQPRWIGRAYWDATPRIAIVLINPGSGEGYNETSNRKQLAILQRYAQETATLQDVFALQANDFANWGHGRFVRFYIEGLKLRLNEIALVNIAWCATEDNQYPARILAECFERHTKPLLNILSPNTILLSGSHTHSFGIPIQQILPKARIIRTLHYAHRKSDEEERKEILRVRAIIEDENANDIIQIDRTNAPPARLMLPDLPRTGTGSHQDLTPATTRANIEQLQRYGLSNREFSHIHHKPGETLHSHDDYLARTHTYRADSKNLVVAQRLDWMRQQLERVKEPIGTEFWLSLAEEAANQFRFPSCAE